MDEKAIRTDVDGLTKLVTLPEHVQSVRWRRTRSKGGSSLVAVVRVERSGIDDLLRRAPRLDVQSPLRISEEVADLFSETTGGAGASGPFDLRGINVDPRPFVDSHKSGLVNGLAAIVPERGIVYLALYEI